MSFCPVGLVKQAKKVFLNGCSRNFKIAWYTEHWYCDTHKALSLSPTLWLIHDVKIWFVILASAQVLTLLNKYLNILGNLWFAFLQWVSWQDRYHTYISPFKCKKQQDVFLHTMPWLGRVTSWSLVIKMSNIKWTEYLPDIPNHNK